MKWSAENAGWKPTRRNVLLSALSLWIGPTPRGLLAENDLMARIDHDFGKLNPKAPAALSHFAFLIGRWRCEARIKSPSGEQKFGAEWLGRFILDGYAIADEYSMTSSSGDLIVLGMNIRTYDAARQIWNIRWLNALTGTWTDLASEELGGVRFESQSVTYAFKEPVASHAYTRATYTTHSGAHFTWKGEKSDDGKKWSEFMVVECYRSND